MQSDSSADVLELQQQYSLPQLCQFQLEDSDIAPVLLWKEERTERPGLDTVVIHSPATRCLRFCWDMLQVKGALYKEFKGNMRLVTPRALRKEILQLLHCSPMSEQLGVKKTKYRISQTFYWNHLKDDVYQFVQSCNVCSTNSQSHRNPKAPLGELY